MLKITKAELLRRLTDRTNLALIGVQVLGLLVSYGVIDTAAAQQHENALGTILFVLATAGIIRETPKA
jgi:energy-converting hydrogenase Eha subunit C